MARVRFEFKRLVAYQVALRFFGWTAALLDALLATGLITQEEFDEREEQLAEIGARITRLCQRYDAGVHGAEPRRSQGEGAASNSSGSGGFGRAKAEPPPGKGRQSCQRVKTVPVT